MIGVSIGLIIFMIQGFSRLLGVMHMFWFPLIYFLWIGLNQIPVDNVFGIWICAVILLNSLSLGADVIDVIRTIAGEKKG